jgi:hypothetical protein
MDQDQHLLQLNDLYNLVKTARYYDVGRALIKLAASKGKSPAPLLLNRPTYTLAGLAGNPLEIAETAETAQSLLLGRQMRPGHFSGS